jgi:Resolvase, N terminal domain
LGSLEQNANIRASYWPRANAEAPVNHDPSASRQTCRLLPRQHPTAAAFRARLSGTANRGTRFSQRRRLAAVVEVTEVESGKRSDRPKPAEALKLCRLHGAVAVIAKLDRLVRNVAFISNLMESGAEFHAVDFPQANRLTVHILAARSGRTSRSRRSRIRSARLVISSTARRSLCCAEPRA